MGKKVTSSSSSTTMTTNSTISAAGGVATTSSSSSGTGTTNSKRSNNANTATTTKDLPPLQAILLADLSSSGLDSSRQCFGPLLIPAPDSNNSNDKNNSSAAQRVSSPVAQQPTIPPSSLCLCPINNKVILDYTIEFLIASAVEELYVFCMSNAVEEYIQQHYGGITRNSTRNTTGSIQIIIYQDKSITNAGDALREIDKKNIIRSDPFILVYGDTITNVDLSIPIGLHRQRHEQDSSAIMTICMKSIGNNNNNHHYTRTRPSTTTAGTTTTSRSGTAGHDYNKNTFIDSYTTNSSKDQLLQQLQLQVSPPHTIRPWTDDLIVGLDPNQMNRLVLYDSKPYRNKSNNNNNTFNIPCSFFTVHSEIEVRYDLYDTGIDLCSPDVLARFSDEFDYRNIRTEFVTNSVCEEEEGLQNKIYIHFFNSNEYVGRIVDTATYAGISYDLLLRWCYPIVPDHMTFSINPEEQQQHQPPYRYIRQQHYLYRATMNDRMRIGRSSIIVGPGMIGRNCYIGENCMIEGSVVGNFCHIGQETVLRGSHVWDHVHIGDGVTVILSIIGHGAVIKDHAVIQHGCIIGPGCIIGEGIIVPPFTRLTAQSQDQERMMMLLAEDGWDDDDDDNDNDSNNSNNNDVGKNHVHGGGIATNVDENDDMGELLISDEAVVGSDGLGRIWHPPPMDNDEDDNDDNDDNHTSHVDPERIRQEKRLHLLQLQSIGYNPFPNWEQRLDPMEEPYDNFSEDEDDDFVAQQPFVDAFSNVDDDGVDFGSGNVGGGGSSSISNNNTTTANPPYSDSGDHVMITGRQRGIDVIKELKTICLEYESFTPIENLAIELNSYKFSQNAQYSDCVTAAMMAILERMNILKGISHGKLIADFKAQLTHWAPLLRKMSLGIDEEKAILVGVERCATSSNHASTEGGTTTTNSGDMMEVLSTGMSFRLLLQTLHDEEIVSEEAILDWAKERQVEGTNTERGKLFQLQPVQDFIEWLQQASEDDDDEDDE